VGCSSNVRFDAGKYILREGEEANTFYLLRFGKVALELVTPNKGAIIIETLDQGDILGWSWLIPPYMWRFDAKAIELTRAIAIDGKCLRRKVEADHDLGYEIMKRFSELLSKRFEATRFQLLDMYGNRP
jgi:CRP-like cAMP-binding protein